MHPLRLRKRESLSNVSREPLAERAIEAFHVRGRPALFIYLLMGFLCEHLAVGVPKVREALALAVALGNLLPQLRAGVGVAVADGKGHDLPRSTAERRRKPSLVVFLAYKAPCFRRVRARRLRGLARASRPTALAHVLFLSQRESVLRLTPKTRSIARIDPRSW